MTALANVVAPFLDCGTLCLPLSAAEILQVSFIHKFDPLYVNYAESGHLAFQMLHFKVPPVPSMPTDFSNSS